MTASLNRLLAFIRLGRLHFLAGGFVFYGLGVAMALHGGVPLKLPALIWGQIAVTATQVMVHYANEYFDLYADRANRTPTRWSGGSRVLVKGLLPPNTALTAARMAALAALGATAMLVWVARTAPLTLPLLLTAMALAWAYSAPPLRLQARGLGEVSAALLVPGLTALTGYYLQAGHIPLPPALSVVPLCILQFAMLIVIAFPDAASDAATGKRTLVVRLGGARAARLHNLALLAAYAALPLLAWAGMPPVATVAAALGAPLAAWQGWRIARGDWVFPARQDRLGLVSTALLVGMGAAELAAYLLIR